MGSPALLVCDADSLIQFLLIGEIRLLRLLRSKYSVQPVVVPEVEIEMRSGKFAAEIAPELTRAFANGVVRMLDRPFLESCYGGSGGSMAATAALSKIAKTGAEYDKHVDRGEAYTHAAALTLAVPALSNDKNALDVLVNAKQTVPPTVLRSFDLVALGYQIKLLSEGDCDRIRSDLLARNEGVPKCFAHKSFIDGLKAFTPRIRDSKLPLVGREQPQPPFPYATPIDL
jgi:hypothetical protein